MDYYIYMVDSDNDCKLSLTGEPDLETFDLDPEVELDFN